MAASWSSASSPSWAIAAAAGGRASPAAADPALAERLYLLFVETLRGSGLEVGTGVFRAMMQVELVNDGPVTFLLDSRKSL